MLCGVNVNVNESMLTFQGMPVCLCEYVLLLSESSHLITRRVPTHRTSHPGSKLPFCAVAPAYLCFKPPAVTMALLPRVSGNSFTLGVRLVVLACTCMCTPGGAAFSKHLNFQTFLPDGMWEMTCSQQPKQSSNSFVLCRFD